MQIIKKDPGKGPEIIDTDMSLESLQKLVGGYIEAVKIRSVVNKANDPFVLLCNEEGKLQQLPRNIELAYRVYPPYRDVINGTLLIVGSADDDFCGIDQDGLDYWVGYLNNWSVIFL